jgi:hypothetical protein
MRGAGGTGALGRAAGGTVKGADTAGDPAAGGDGGGGTGRAGGAVTGVDVPTDDVTGGATTGRAETTGAVGGATVGVAEGAAGFATAGATVVGRLTAAGGTTAGFSAAAGAAGRAIAGAAASFFCVIALSTSPGREMLERSIFVLISSSPRSVRELDLPAGDEPSAEERIYTRTFSASCSSRELECVFFSVTPTSGSVSRMALLLTSSSRARSLIRTLLIRPFISPCCKLGHH